MNTLISANPLVYIKTPIRHTQRTLCILWYTQTVPRGRLCNTHDPQQMLCDITCTFVSHRNGSVTPVTDNDGPGQELNVVAARTAVNDLNDLIKKRIIERRGRSRRDTRYILPSRRGVDMIWSDDA